MHLDNLYSLPADVWRTAVQSKQCVATKLAVEVLDDHEMIQGAFQNAINDTLDKVITGDIKRLIINIPPGYGKTLSAVWSFISRGFVINPRARFIHTSYSSELALDNSSKVRDILESEAFQYFNPMSFKSDTKAKGLWRTDAGGGLRAVQSGGGMTGFRAGQIGEGFTGAFIIDDPLKPDDARSPLKVKTQNSRYNSTIASRLANEDVPIILVMQRICTRLSTDLEECGDMSEFLLRGGSGEMWHHLQMPVVIDSAVKYNPLWTHGIPVDHGLPDGLLWERKHKQDDVARLNRANTSIYNAQYLQRPMNNHGAGIVKEELFGTYRNVDASGFNRLIVTADTAEKVGENNAYSVFGLFATKYNDKNLYLLDLIRFKEEIEGLESKAIAFFVKHHNKRLNSNPSFSTFEIEDKSSGTQLIQKMKKKYGVKKTERDKDASGKKLDPPPPTGKWESLDAVASFLRLENSKIMLPSEPTVYSADIAWVVDYKSELMDCQVEMDSVGFWDQADVTSNAGAKLLLSSAKLDAAMLF